MKKSIFILAALFAATFANAQITLEYTFDDSKNTIVQNGFQTSGWSNNGIRLYGDIAVVANHSPRTLDIYDLNTYSVIGTINRNNDDTYIVAKGYFKPNDEVVIFEAVSDNTNTEQPYHLYLFNIDGTIFQDLGGCSYINTRNEYFHIFQLSNGKYKMSICIDNKIRIYSLPGNGVATDENEVSAPLRNNARKYINNDQVLIESNEKTYNMKGQLVR